MSVKLIDLYADWCQPCRVMEPVIKELEKENPKVEFERVDIQTNPQRAVNENVLSIPTFIITKDGEEVGRITGLASKGDLQKLLSA